MTSVPFDIDHGDLLLGHIATRGLGREPLQEATLAAKNGHAVPPTAARLIVGIAVRSTLPLGLWRVQERRRPTRLHCRAIRPSGLGFCLAARAPVEQQATGATQPPRELGKAEPLATIARYRLALLPFGYRARPVQGRRRVESAYALLDRGSARGDTAPPRRHVEGLLVDAQVQATEAGYLGLTVRSLSINRPVGRASTKVGPTIQSHQRLRVEGDGRTRPHRATRRLRLRRTSPRHVAECPP